VPGRGRPPLRIGEHGRISRTYLGGGVWRAECRHRDADGVTRKVRRVGPPDENDRKGKLAEDALIEALAERRPPGGTDTISLDTLVVTLVNQHIDRLAEDGRSVRTIDTYKYDATKLAKFVGGLRVGEATPARVDAAVRSMRRVHGDVMAVQSKTLLKGALHLAVMANVIGSNPVRDVSPIRSKSGPKGAAALTADQLRGLLGKLRQSESCQRRDMVDPITRPDSDGTASLRAIGAALDRPRCRRRHHHRVREGGAPARQGSPTRRRDEDGCRSAHGPVAVVRGDHVDREASEAVPRSAGDDLPLDDRYASRS
jgi:hypothetical protein